MTLNDPEVLGALDEAEASRNMCRAEAKMTVPRSHLDSSLRQAAELAVLVRLARSEAQRIPGPAAHAARESAS